MKKIFKIKGIGYVFLAFAAGILLFIFPTEKSQEETSSSAQYIKALEDELKNLLETATGCKCSVMITTDTGYSYVYAANDKLTTNYNESGITSKTVSKDYVIVSSGGKDSLVILKESPPSVSGVAVVCKNGNEKDEERILLIVKSLFDLPDNAISCISGK